MDSSSHSALWLAVHAAYEAHDLDEARRLLQNGTSPLECSTILHCGDEDYVRWLLSNELISLPPGVAEIWPDLQELQLQCNSIDEAARPRCILHGKLE